MTRVLIRSVRKTALLLAACGALAAGPAQARPLVPPEVLDKLLDRYFVQMASVPGAGLGQPTLNISATDPSLVLSLGTRLGGHDVVGLSFKGASVSGVSPLFENGELSSDFKASFTYARQAPMYFRIGGQDGADRTLQTYTDSEHEYAAALRKLTAEHDMATRARRAEYLLVPLVEKRLTNKRDALVREKERWEAYREKKGSALSKDSLLIVTGLVDSLALEQERAIAQLESESDKLPSGVRSEIADNEFADNQAKLIGILKPVGANLAWFTFGVAFARTSFKRLDTTKPDTEQVMPEIAESFEASVRWSRLHWDATEGTNWLLMLRGEVRSASNLSSLKRVNVVETRDVASVPGARAIRKEFSAFTGAYKERTNQLDVGADAYLYMDRQNRSALHVFPTLRSLEQTRSTADVGVGVLARLRTNAEAKSPVMAEIFVRWPDLLHRSSASADLLKSAVVGVVAEFPLSLAPKE